MKALVTGGGGFIGSALVRELVKRGYEITSFSRGDYPELSKTGVKVVRGDLSDAGSVINASAGQDILFHVAAKAGSAGTYKDYFTTNVTGTENIINACRINKIKFLIYTSSASVVFGGTGIEGGDESLPYPLKPLSHYTATKALAEQLILNANSESLRTLLLRPHIVYGPGDNNLLPSIISRAKSGTLRRIGTGKNKVDVTYIENAIAAHLAAAKALMENDGASGKAYFISNGEPVLLWDFMNKILSLSEIDPVKKSIPFRVAWILSIINDIFHKLFLKQQESMFTRFLVQELSQNHWFDISNARMILKYNPEISNDESLKKMAAMLKSSQL